MEKFKTHPIQIASIHVRKLYINVNDPSAYDDAEGYSKNFEMEVAVSEFDETDNLIHVRMRAKIGILAGEEGSDEFTDDQDSPINLMVDLRGTLEVDPDNFPLDKVEHFAMNNAALLIYPYLREHVMGLTIRAGLPGLILPLFIVPPFKLQK